MYILAKRKMHVIANLAKFKMKCGTDESGISFESNILEISKKNRIEHEYSVASNSIRILKTERYRDVLPGRGVTPWLQRIDLLVF